MYDFWTNKGLKIKIMSAVSYFCSPPCRRKHLPGSRGPKDPHFKFCHNLNGKPQKEFKQQNGTSYIHFSKVPLGFFTGIR